MSPAGPGAPAARTTGTEALAVVVTAGVTAYRRDDGVLVLPLACLRP